MKVGFTGTDKGWTKPQEETIIKLVGMFTPITEFHHGDCIGSDEQMHCLVVSKGVNKIVIHPPVNPKARAFCDEKYILDLTSIEVEIRENKPYLIRNHDIVDDTEVLIATPQTMTEVLRSGTWATIRYARRKARKIYIVLPDGDIKIEEWVKH